MHVFIALILNHMSVFVFGGSLFFDNLQKNFSINKIDFESVSSTLEIIKPGSKVIISYHRSDINPWKDTSFSEKQLKLIDAISRKHQVILDVFVNPYPLRQIQFIENIDAILVSYQNNQISQDVSSDILSGIQGVNGVLPVSINSDFKVGFGIKLPAKYLFTRAEPKSMGFNENSRNMYENQSNQGKFLIIKKTLHIYSESKKQKHKNH